MASEINDEIMMPCAQCALKHLSAFVAYYADYRHHHVEAFVERDRIAENYVARAIINMTEALEGYESHMDLARGFLVMAEDRASVKRIRDMIRRYRLESFPLGIPPDYLEINPTNMEMAYAHLEEAEREYPKIRDAVDRSDFYKETMTVHEMDQAELNYRLAQIRWIEKNAIVKESLGTKSPEEEGGDEVMACGTKGMKPAKKVKALKAACKGGKCGKKKGCK